MDIFSRRVCLKPEEYPQVLAFADAINESFWIFKEWSFEADKLDFALRLSPAQTQVVERALLAISQIEVSVKLFWARLGERFPKPEIIAVGVTFAESEVRHQRAYSHLLEVLGLNEAFNALLDEPVMLGRVNYLTKFLAGADEQDDQKFAVTVAMFALFIENVSLFSQFAIVKSFNRHLNVLKDVDNVIMATMKEEMVHAKFGCWLLNQIRAERPHWFADGQFQLQLHRACRKAYEAEVNIIRWILESGEAPGLPLGTLLSFVKQRFNESLEAIGIEPLYQVDEQSLEPLRWLQEEIHAPTHVDFFHQKSVNYAKATQVYSPESLF